MKSIVAIVRPHVVPRLMNMLKSQFEIVRGSIKEVKGYGRQKSYLDDYQGSEYSKAFLPKVMIELTVPKESAEALLARIVATTRTGRMGDGKIFVFDHLGVETGDEPLDTDSETKGESEP